MMPMWCQFVKWLFCVFGTCKEHTTSMLSSSSPLVWLLCVEYSRVYNTLFFWRAGMVLFPLITARSLKSLKPYPTAATMKGSRSMSTWWDYYCVCLWKKKIDFLFLCYGTERIIYHTYTIFDCSATYDFQ